MAQHAVHLAEEPAEVGDLRQRTVAERHVDGVRAQEREVGEIPGVELEADLRGLRGSPRRGDAGSRTRRRR